jgi:hypothetical protein
VLKPNNDVYEEVVKPLLEKFKLDVESSFYVPPPQIRHPRRELESISIVNKLTLIIVECLFHNYFASHFRLMFYVLCRDSELGHF